MASSSPIVYPQTSSPTQVSPRKKRKLEHDQSIREPLQVLSNGGNASMKKTVGGFFVDDDSEDEGYVSWKQQCSSPLQDLAAERQAEQNQHKTADSTTEFQPIEEAEALSLPSPIEQQTTKVRILIRTCSGRTYSVRQRSTADDVHYSRIAASRSVHAVGKAQRSYFGVDVHAIVDQISASKPQQSKEVETVPPSNPISCPYDAAQAPTTSGSSQLWTEKYRPRKFTDLVGDERTHRAVLKWLKCWDPLVFPHLAQKSARLRQIDNSKGEMTTHRKLLILTGPPGLGKTTLAQVCARQAGYEVQEINASDERSRDVVRGRIKDMLATENVRPTNASGPGSVNRPARPVCVVVDEVDGVTTGTGGAAAGEGGFIKALIELMTVDQKNTKATELSSTISNTTRRSRKGDLFRMMRPLILICNDLYHPSLRPLRQSPASSFTEIVHVRRPQLSNFTGRLQSIFETEGAPCEADAVRHLCENVWGIPSRRERGTSTYGVGEGDMRSLLVVGEWVVSKYKAMLTGSMKPSSKLSKNWMEANIIASLNDGESGARNLGRCGSREVVERVFKVNAGFSSSATGPQRAASGRISQIEGAAIESTKAVTMSRLQTMVQSCGEDDRILTDCFSTYPTIAYQDDTFFTKPCHALEWLAFHSELSQKVYSEQSWELMQYLSYPVLAFHHLFASSKFDLQSSMNPCAKDAEASESDATTIHPLHTSYAPRHANEAQKANQSTLTNLHSTLSISLQRAFKGPADLSTDLIPYLLRILSPDVKPVVVGGVEKGVASVRRGPEKARVNGAVEAMIATGVRLDRSRVEHEQADAPGSRGLGFVYRMEPALDELGEFGTASGSLAVSNASKVRYAVRQVIEQEWKRETARRDQEARLKRATGESQAMDADKDKASVFHNSGGKCDQGKPGSTERVPASDSRNMAKKKDFFGRPVTNPTTSSSSEHTPGQARASDAPSATGDYRVWVSFHEGYSNAVRKPITMKELLDDL